MYLLPSLAGTGEARAIEAFSPLSSAPKGDALTYFKALSGL